VSLLQSHACHSEREEEVNPGTKLIVGVDECGVGAIAGPMVLAAVAFRSGTRQPVLKRFDFEKSKDIPIKDSKKLSRSLLMRMVELVWETCVDYEILVRSAAEVDAMGAGLAQVDGLKAVTHRLLERIASQHPGEFEDYDVIVDGDIPLGKATFKYRTRAHADRDVWQVAAASIVAKDRQLKAMHELHQRDSRFCWDRNAGYPTPNHLTLLKRYGVSRHHRRSYTPIKHLLTNT
jgi:ribonuclease HII